MKKSIYDQLGGFIVVRKLISSFYEYVLDEDELSPLFEHVNMERLIDHQTKFFAMLLGGPVSFSDNELKHAHSKLGISNRQFDLTKECLNETLEDFDIDQDHSNFILEAFEGKRHLIVYPN